MTWDIFVFFEMEWRRKTKTRVIQIDIRTGSYERKKSTMAARNVYISWTMAFALYWCRMYVLAALPLRVLFSFHNSNFFSLFFFFFLFIYFHLVSHRRASISCQVKHRLTRSTYHTCVEEMMMVWESCSSSSFFFFTRPPLLYRYTSFESRTVHLKRCFVHYEADYCIQLVGTRRLLNPLASSESRLRIKGKWENFCCRISFSRLYEKQIFPRSFFSVNSSIKTNK